MNRFKLVLALCLCFSLLSCISEEESWAIIQDYFKRRLEFKGRLKMLDLKNFIYTFSKNIFERVSKTGELARHDHFGFAYECMYTFPRTSVQVNAVVKFDLEFEYQNVFRKSLEWARLSGDLKAGMLPGNDSSNYSFDQSEMVVQVNFNGTQTVSLNRVGRLFEMQWIPDEANPLHPGLTVLVYTRGAQDLTSPIFSKGPDQDLAKNTKKLVQMFLDVCRGIRNINANGILYGGLDESKVILVKDSFGNLWPKIIDFEQSVKWETHEEHFDIILRYLPFFRAPSIESRKSTPSRGSPLLTSEMTFYSYSPDMREDTYALAKLFERMLEVNGKFIDLNDSRIQNILDLIKGLILKSEFVLEHVPTSSEWVDIVNRVISSTPPRGAELVKEFIEVYPTPRRKQLTLQQRKFVTEHQLTPVTDKKKFLGTQTSSSDDDESASNRKILI